MKLHSVLLFLLSVLPLVAMADKKPVFLMTCAKKIRAGTLFPVNVMLLQQMFSVDFEVNLITNDKVLASAKTNFVGKLQWDQQTISLQIPSNTEPGEYKLNLNVKSSFNNYEESQNTSIEVLQQSGLILIQTDKGIYKPGQTVKIRAIVVSDSLKPQMKNVHVSVKDPDGNKIEQWKNLTTNVGVAKMEVKLANELPLGVWKIQASVAGSLDMITDVNITVDKYVLPRFDVVLKLPSNFAIYRPDDTGMFDFSLVSKYTYGKSVKGKAKVWIKHDENQPEQVLTSDLNNDGTASFSVKLQKAELIRQYGYFYCRKTPMVTVTAQVEEAGTGVTESASGSVEIKAKQFEISFENVDPSFSSLTPYTAYVKVVDMERDGGIVPNNLRDIFQIKVFMNGSNGQVYAKREFLMPQTEGNVFAAELQIPDIRWEKEYNYYSLELKALLFVNGVYKGSTDTQYIYPFVSQSTMGIKLSMWHMDPEGGDKGYVTSPVGKFEKNQEIWFKTYSRSNTIVHFEVYSKGNVVARGYNTVTLVPDSAEVYECTFKVSVDDKCVPEVTVLVYTVTTTGEVIADSLDFMVTGVLKEKATVSFDEAQVDVATDVHLTVNSGQQTKSYVGIVAVDKSSLLLQDPNDIGASQVLSALQKLTFTKKKEFTNFRCYCGCWLFRKRRSVLQNRRNGESAFYVIDEAGVIMLTDAVITKSGTANIGSGGGDIVFAMAEGAGVLRRKNGDDSSKTTTVEKNPGHVRKNFPETWIWDDIETGSGYGGFDGWIMFDAMPEMAMAGKEVNAAPNPVPTESSNAAHVRKKFPETWIFDDSWTSDDGVYTKKYTVPDTITSWITSAFVINNVTGLDVPPTKAKLIAFRNFFIVLNLPYSVRRGESFPLEIFVFNYLPHNIKADVVLEASDNFRAWPVSATEEDLKDVKKAVKAQRMASVSVPSQNSGGFTVWILPQKLGNIKINVMAKYLQHIDRLSKDLLVEPEGTRVFKAMPKLVDVSDSTESFSVEVQRDSSSNIVPGSEYLEISVIGDTMGTSMNNLDRLVRVPCGCGEQNMITLVPNIFALKYLKSVDRLTASLKDKAEGNIKLGYQRELTYRHKDGSFSAFGESDKSGSTWLTAFVVRSFVQADEFISVDKDIIAKSVTWLMSQFTSGDSNIMEPGVVHHSDMQGGSGQAGIGLTTYAFISLYEADSTMNLNSDVKGLSAKITSVKNVLTQNFQKNIDKLTNFELSILAYAFALCKSNTYADQALAKLEERRTMYEGLKFWRDSKEEYNPWVMKNNRRCWHQPTPTPSQIEIASYTLLAYVTKSNFQDSRSIVKWLMGQMNDVGGFSSTQDTVLGLQSLAEFARLMSSDNSMSINVNVKADSAQENLSVDTSNRFLLQTAKILTLFTSYLYGENGHDNMLLLPPTASFIDVTATGTGMAQIVTSWRYNVKKLSDDDSDLLEVIIDIITINSNSYDMKIKVSYKGSKPSHMGLITADMLSGFIGDQTFTQNKNKGLVSRVDVRSDQVDLYVNEFTSRPQTYTVRANRNMIVADLQEVFVKAQLYYEPEVKKSVFYQAPANINLNRWELDGFPDRTISSAKGMSSGLLSIITMLIAMFFSKF